MVLANLSSKLPERRVVAVGTALFAFLTSSFQVKVDYFVRKILDQCFGVAYRLD